MNKEWHKYVEEYEVIKANENKSRLILDIKEIKMKNRLSIL